MTENRVIFRRIRGKLRRMTVSDVNKGLSSVELARHAKWSAASAVALGVISKPKRQIKVNQALKALSLGSSVASGAFGAATFFSKSKTGFIGGIVGGVALDTLSTISAAGAVAGHGRIKDRVREGTRLEATNTLAGNAVFFGGLLGSKRNRKKLGIMAAKGARFIKKGVKLVF